MYGVVMLEKKIIGGNISLAGNFLKRLKGLMGESEISSGEGMLLYPCKQVHTWFMRFPIDVVFMDKQGKVVHLINNMENGRMSKYINDSYQVLELPAGSIAKHELVIGHKLTIICVKN